MKEIRKVEKIGNGVIHLLLLAPTEINKEKHLIVKNHGKKLIHGEYVEAITCINKKKNCRLYKCHAIPKERMILTINIPPHKKFKPVIYCKWGDRDIDFEAVSIDSMDDFFFKIDRYIELKTLHLYTENFWLILIKKNAENAVQKLLTYKKT